MSIIYIKNMVCSRCIMVVKDIFKNIGLNDVNVEMGKVSFSLELTADQFYMLQTNLENVGFEIINDQKSKIIELIKNAVIELVWYKLSDINVNYSTYLEDKVGKEYNYMSHLFSATQGQTIEKYIINQKIERVKELLVYDLLSLTEIAFELGYSSVSHLSNQFKKVTGLSPGYFKEIGFSKRKAIDKI